MALKVGQVESNQEWVKSSTSLKLTGKIWMGAGRSRLQRRGTPQARNER